MGGDGGGRHVDGFALVADLIGCDTTTPYKQNSDAKKCIEQSARLNHVPLLSSEGVHG